MVRATIFFCGFFLGMMMGSAAAMSPTADELRKAVQQLGDEHFPTREKAMRLLWNAGATAEPFLKEAINSPDPEVARRARLLMDRIIYRIDPGTPPEIITLVQRYRNGTPEQQISILREMLRIGSKAHPYLLRMLDAVDQRRRQIILDQFAFDDWKVLAPLVVGGQDSVVEEILTKAVAAKIDSIIPHFAAYFADSAKLADRITTLQAEVERTHDPFSAKLLLALYRLRGDRQRMLWAAERTQQPELLRLLLHEQGKWTEILDKYPPQISTGLNQITGLGYLAAYQRLAGKNQEFEETLKKIDEYAASPQPRRDNRPAYAAKALLINGRTDRALALLIFHEQYAGAADLLLAQGRYREALELTEKAAKAESGPKHADRAFHVLSLHRAGLNDEARNWLAALQKDMDRVNDVSWLERQIEMEAKLGLRDAARAHLQHRIEQNDTSYLALAFAHLLPNLAGRAETLFRLFRHKFPHQSIPDLFKRLEAVDAGTHDAAELSDVLKTAAPSPAWMPTQSLAYGFDNLASLVLWLEMPDVAQSLLSNPAWEKAPSSALLPLADALATAERWETAAAAYRKVWEADHTLPLPYFLHGWALTKLGKQAEGKAIMQRAHRISLGSEPARQLFHAALVERGFLTDAAEEMAMRIKLLPRDAYYFGQMQIDAARAAAARGDFLESAAIQERSMLRFLTASLGYRGTSAYIRATSNIHVHRARGLLEQRRIADALIEIAAAESRHSAHLELPIVLAAALEKHGEKAKADEIYARHFRALDQLTKEYPNAADPHNQIAWLAVRCRRNLDQALAHAQKATTLSPLTASYLDTLAEVHFQRGERDKAVELITKCLKMPSGNVAFYRQQLQRFKHGKPQDEPSLEN